MKFIDPRTDFAFKKIFGSEQSKPILISFLNAMLYDEQPIIEDLEIIDPYLAPKIQGMKDNYVDVKARLRGGISVIIEMQILNMDGLEKRILYNAAKSYSLQIEKGEDYRKLNAVIALTITDFVMFPEHQELQSAFVLKEKSRLTDYPVNDLELVFVELPKFTQTLEELVGVKEKWLYFLRQTPSLKLIPETMSDVPEIEQAFDMANQASLTPEELDIQERKLLYINAPRWAVERALRTGREQGEAKGKAEGKAEGSEEKAREIARKLLTQMTDTEIAALTGLPLTDIAALRTES